MFETPDAATEPFQRFLDDVGSVVSFVIYVGQVTTRSEPTTHTRGTASQSEDFGRQLGAFSSLLFEMVLTRLVDAFSIYLSHLFGLIFRTRPETLRSGEQITVAEVLQHDSVDEIVSFLAERRVERLSYGGLRALVSDVEKEMGFALTDPEYLTELTHVVEVRNLIVHNRGIVNATYRKRVKTTAEPGERVQIDSGYLDGAVDLLGGTASAIDRRAAHKFALSTNPTIPLEPEVAAALYERRWLTPIGQVEDPEQAGGRQHP